MPREKGTLVFDIETIPDIPRARRLYALDNLTDAEAFEALKNIRRQETGGSTASPISWMALHLRQRKPSAMASCAG